MVPELKDLCDYSWPGNIRELRSVMTRAGIDYEGAEIGLEIADFFEKDFPSLNLVLKDEKLDRIWRDIMEGKIFWEVVKDPFMKRDICREDVKSIVQRALKESSGKGNMKDCLPVLNIPSQELKKFLDFMRDYQVMQ